MSGENTAEQVQQQYVEAMGSKLGDLFFELWNECVTLHWKWGEYVALFGTTEKRIDILNEAAGAFFWVVQDTLWDDVLLRLARLTDPPQQGGKKNPKENLTLLRLPLLVDASLRTEVERLLQECCEKCDFARDWRNRRIAHNDLALLLEHASAAPLARASRKHVKDALSSIVALLNAVQVHYQRSEAMYELHTHGDAVSLLYVLRDGLEVEAKRMERLKSGNPGPDDFGPPRAI